MYNGVPASPNDSACAGVSIRRIESRSEHDDDDDDVRYVVVGELGDAKVFEDSFDDDDGIVVVEYAQ